MKPENIPDVLPNPERSNVLDDRFETKPLDHDRPAEPVKIEVS